VLVIHSWPSIGLKGFTQPLASAIVALGLGTYCIRYGFRLRWKPLPVVVLLFTALIFIGLQYTPAPTVALKRAAQYLTINLLVFSVVLLNHDSRVLSRLLWGIVGFGMAIAVLSMVDIVFVSGLVERRYSLADNNPIWYARAIGLTIILLLALTSEMRRPALQCAKWIMLLLLFYLMVLAGSRGPLLAAVITVVIYLYWVPGRRVRSLRVLPVISFILLITLVYYVIPRPEIAGRLETLYDLSAFHRLEAVITAGQLFLDKPLMGIGTAGFAAHSPGEYPHNIIIEIASEYGLVGVVLMLTALALVVVECRRIARKLASHPRELSLLRGFTLIVIYASINAQVSGSITGNSWIWLGIGGIWALGTLVDDNLRNRPVAGKASG
jgi:O-antigen ligase